MQQRRSFGSRPLALFRRTQPEGPEEPLKAELLSISQLERHAQTLAEWQRVRSHEAWHVAAWTRFRPSAAGAKRRVQHRVGKHSLLARLDDNHLVLRRAYALVSDAVTLGKQLTPAAEWFVDNYHLIEEQIRLARLHLPRGYNRELPRLANGPTAGMPRVYELALELISHAHGRVDLDALSAFIASYQTVQPLLLGELWAIPIMLRLALIENLRRIASRITAGRLARESAQLWADRLVTVTATDPARAVLILAQMTEDDVPLVDAFVAELASRLQGIGPSMGLPLAWLEQRLSERAQTIEHAYQWTAQSQAADQVATANSIGSLRFLSSTDWRDFVESQSVVERALRTDPSQVYAQMDFATRDRYRHAVEGAARTCGLTQEEIAKRAVLLSASASEVRQQHVGYFLIDEGRAALLGSIGTRALPRFRGQLGRLLRRQSLLLYVLSTLAITSIAAFALRSTLNFENAGSALQILYWVSLVFCLHHFAVAIAQWLATVFVKPDILPRLDFQDGVPETRGAAIVVPTLLSDVETTSGLLELLEIRFLQNRDRNFRFGLLTDYRDANAATMPGDEALLSHARIGIDELNARHRSHAEGSPFFLCHRARKWNPNDNVWMGWERKRGKLEDFNRLLRGDSSGFAVCVGNIETMQGFPYVIVQDSDTELPRGCAHQLVATLAHPLNRASWDPTKGIVTAGYTILQPRVGATMFSANYSRYSQLFAGDPGLDPYTRAVSDVYQDVFGEGSFIGKGIYDVDGMRRACGGRFPDNRILSHDLLEGAYGRAGLVSDLTLYEDHPAGHLVDITRRSRWIRGDWQIARWVTNRVPDATGKLVANPISLLSRLKIFDNLRRSVIPIALLTLLGVGWVLPQICATATVVALGTLFLPGILVVLAKLAARPLDVSRALHFRESIGSLRSHFARELFALACLPSDAWVSAVAIGRAHWRLLVSHRDLLEWRTAADAARAEQSTLLGTFRSMFGMPVVAACVAVALRNSLSFQSAIPFLALWAATPGLVWWIGRRVPEHTTQLSFADILFLRTVSRKTWQFFETVVTAEDNHLPPDNLQEDLGVGLAHRTSPTNIGCALAANLAAYDFGYVTTQQVVGRTTATLAALDRLPRFHGHFYNWYDTRSLEPLRPMYVSTVDSGNLAGMLLTLATGLEELQSTPIFRQETLVGCNDVVEILVSLGGPSLELSLIRELLHRTPEHTASAHALLRQLCTAAAALTLHIDSLGHHEMTQWSRSLEAQLHEAVGDLEYLVPWLLLPPATASAAARKFLSFPTLETLASDAQHEASLDPQGKNATELQDAVQLGGQRASLRCAELRRLALRCAEFADHDMELFYDRKRKLLSIGYNVVDHRLDTAFYDLLASEARMASYIAIAQGKLPQEHWFHLGRQLTAAGGGPALLSWSGSMFEYLMPLMVMPTYNGTMLDTTYRSVVTRQIEYGKERGTPWGVSESGYNKTDTHLNYQYQAFGVPGLGFKRGLAEQLVIAPYASAMALMVAPAAACANLRLLADIGLLGQHGFYEAIDYTPSRVPPGSDAAIVRSYMAHHQGMTFLSLLFVVADRPMQRRFAAHPALRAATLLLQERVPRTPAIFPHPAEVSSIGNPVDAESASRTFTSPSTSGPEVALLSNGRYHVMVSNAGGGYSRFRDIAVTRWHEDPTRDPWGSFCYIRDVQSGSFWSATHQPTLSPSANCEATFSSGRAEFRRSDDELQTTLEIAVSPEDDVELRKISVSNFGHSARTVELTSFAEVVLSTAAADAAHPAFSNLFVQTEIIHEHGAILCTRRPRSTNERPLWMVHLMSVHAPVTLATTFETARTNFIGRGRSAVDPCALDKPSLDNTEGSVLDPIVAIRNTVRIRHDETVHAHIVTGVAATREEALRLVEKYTDRHIAKRVFELSWAHNQVAQRQLETTNAETQLYERLAAKLLYSSSSLRAPRSLLMRNHSSQAGLWAYGISGDLPILLVRITDIERLPLVRTVLRAHAYLQLRGVRVDLVIWNEDPSGYRQDLQDAIMAVVGRLADSSMIDRPGGVFVRRSDQMSEDDAILMQTVARVVLRDTAGSLAEQLERVTTGKSRTLPFVPRDRSALGLGIDKAPPQHASPVAPQLQSFNGLGGFSADGSEYVVTTSKNSRTPAPWSNVLANPHFGSVVSESGSAYTWCENAHSYRLTPWHNDPVSDPSGEAFYLRDEDDGRFWSPTPLPAGTNASYTTRHGFGYSTFEHEDTGVQSEMQTFVALDAPIKFIVIRLRNASGRPRHLSLTAFYELVLGAHRPQNCAQIVTEVDLRTGAFFARNSYNGEFGKRITFLECSDVHRTITGDRQEFLGHNGTLASPQAMRQARLSGRVGAGFDPCIAMQTTVTLADGERHDVGFVFGCGSNVSEAQALASRFRGTSAAETALEAVRKFWSRTLKTVQVHTPEADFDHLTNGWLLYQVLACRMWARSGYYQSSGAFGFRDQLQDSAALLHASPSLAREHILRAAARQFPEGDVQHWWHPPLGRGVRTRISDDYLWLPSVVCRYVDTIGDLTILDEEIDFVEGRPVQHDEDSYYDLPSRSSQHASLYEHCVRAIRHGLRFGEHGLPLMGTGDWNDGMNLVGENGKGESVWLGFFLYDVLQKFSLLAERRGDDNFALLCREQASRLQQSLDEHGWDGAWYRRAYFDNGEAMGSSTSSECRIDSIPQSWSVLCGAGTPDKQALALNAIDEYLVDERLGVIKLFDPPFDVSAAEPGYIKGYIPGVRENGGQYTHAAVWAVMAFAQAGRTDRAWELFRLIHPISHGSDRSSIARYQVEPYVVAADVYTNPQHEGRGGWTWYTGSAGWMYRLVIESLLGIHLEVDRLRIQPRIPSTWRGYELTYRYRDTPHHIRIRTGLRGATVTRVTADGVDQPDLRIPLHDDGAPHQAEVFLGEQA